MGQNSSKRRSQSKSRGKNEGKSTAPANGDDSNGSIEVRPKSDSKNIDRQGNPPASPTSVTSSSPSNTTGKKEKRKRFRVGFSLKKTPSGRWSRKRKTTSLNGTRPVSCPDPLRPELTEKPDRPQSLFLEDLEIPEEDNKVETVDLSDNEDAKKTSTDADKTTPKAPERSKWRRGSNKKSSGKKKKKEKQTPAKKEKKKKQKHADDVTDVVKPVKSACKEANEGTTKTVQEANTEDSKDMPNLSKLHESIDIEMIASTIVAQAEEIALKRVRAESCNGIASTILTENIAPPVKSEPSSSMNLEAANLPSNSVVLKVGDNTPERKSDTTESTGTLAQDIAYIIDESLKTISESSVEDHNAELKKLVQDENTETKDELVPDSRRQTNVKSEPSDRSLTTWYCQVNTHDSFPEIEDTNVSSPTKSLNEEIEMTAAEEIECRAIAKKTVAIVIAGAIETVQRESFSEDFNKNKDINELKNEFSKLASDSDTDKLKHGEEIEEKTKFEADSTERTVDCKSDESVNKEKKSGVNSGRKSEKEKSKSDTKIKVPKKLSHWFHKKDKLPKTVNEIAIDNSVTNEIKHIPHIVTQRPNQDLDHEQATDSTTHHVESSAAESLHSCQSHSVNTSLMLDVSVQPSVRDHPAESSPDSNEVSCPSASMSPTSPTSDSGEHTPSSSGSDKKFGSSFLKKISIGPRLRTAILRKKSSGASDDQDKNKPILSPPQGNESSILTPPPRKMRQKRAEERQSDTHNTFPSPDSSPQSPVDPSNSTQEFTFHSSSTDTNNTVNDSGVADLTSPEADKPDCSCSENSHAENGVHSGEGTTESTNVADVTFSKLLIYTSKDTFQGDHVIGNSCEDEDDTCPLSQKSSDRATFVQSRSKSMDYYSPLESPTLISTATIVLRSISTDGQVTTPVKWAAETDTDTKILPEYSEGFSGSDIPKSGEDCSTSDGSTSNSFYRELFSIKNSSEFCGQLDKEYKHEQSDKHSQNEFLYSAQSAWEKVEQPNFAGNACKPKQSLNERDHPWSTKEKQFEFSQTTTRTIAEYKIGMNADTVPIRNFEDCDDDSVISSTEPDNTHKDIKEFTEQFQVNHYECDEEEDRRHNSLATEKVLDVSLLEDFSQLEKESIIQNEQIKPVKLQSSVDELMEGSSSSLNMKDNLKISDISKCTNGDISADHAKDNGYHSENVSDEPMCVLNSKTNGPDECGVETDVQCNKNTDVSGGNNHCSDPNSWLELVDTSLSYPKLTNGDIPKALDTSNILSPAVIGKKDDNLKNRSSDDMTEESTGSPGLL